MKQKLRSRTVLTIFSALLVAVTFVLSIYSLEQNGYFHIQEVDILVSTTNSQKNFVAPLLADLKNRLSEFHGASLWQLPLSKVTQLLKQEKWIQDFHISRSWPARLQIEIMAEPIALLIPIDSALFVPLTFSGELLSAIQSNRAPNVIVTSDLKFFTSKKIRDRGLGLVKAMPVQGRLHSSQVSEIGYDKQNGYWIQLLSSPVKINLGEEDFEIKMARVAQVLDYLDNRHLKARVIDANLSKKVLVRMH